jgi:hypothetical protein
MKFIQERSHNYNSFEFSQEHGAKSLEIH